MTKDDIIKMAKEAKMYAEYVTPQGLEWFDTYNERFAALVEAKASEKEREACAKEVYSATDYLHEEGDMILKELIAAAIRARGNSES